MKSLLAEMQFRGKWRDYQARILDELENHLGDGHLHVVAAPGSGKTVLGLEVMRRLGKPALVVAPTLTIRNQWVDRIFELFHAGKGKDARISYDVYQPAELTVVTYQALLSALTGEDPEEPNDADDTANERPAQHGDPEAVIASLRRANIATFVLDEAHHLRKEWWKHIQHLKDELSPTVVSLTATPPYDVEAEQWQRYVGLCGPIDAEISVPELVAKSDLCPHQDFIHFSKPTSSEATHLNAIKDGILKLVDELIRDPAVREMVARFPWVATPAAEADNILKDPKFFTSLLIFRNHAGVPMSEAAREVMGGTRQVLPRVNARWFEVMLQGLLFEYRERVAAEDQLVLEGLQKRLRSMGMIERKRVTVGEVNQLKKTLATSLGKFESIREIVGAESRAMGPALRLVILSDYIRADDGVTKLGVVPIFHYLRTAGMVPMHLAVLTGSLVVLPEAAVAPLREKVRAFGVDSDRIRVRPLHDADGYVVIETTGDDRQRLVHWVTQIFQEGHIRVLVGTQALLGEGWDSPSLNTLILASSVGSFMLSNQMRGRAIRRDPQQPGKVANVWHLATVDVESLAARLRQIFSTATSSGEPAVFDPFEDLQLLGEDLFLMRRRFRAFEGLSHGEPAIIENGIRRMQLKVKNWNPQVVDELNARMLETAKWRPRTAERWRHALAGHSPKPELRQKLVAVEAPPMVSLPFSLKYLLLEAAMTGVGVFALAAQQPRYLLYGAVAGFLAALPKTVRALRYVVTTGSPNGRLREMGRAVLESLHYAGDIKTRLEALRPDAVTTPSGSVLIQLEGGTFHEKTVFLESMAELISPLENPKHLLVRHSSFGAWQREDYHAVPSALSKDARFVKFLEHKWDQYVGPVKTYGTRTAEGRRLLLRGRARSFSSAFVKKSERLSVWE